MNGFDGDPTTTAYWERLLGPQSDPDDPHDLTGPDHGGRWRCSCRRTWVGHRAGRGAHDHQRGCREWQALRDANERRRTDAGSRWSVR